MSLYSQLANIILQKLQNVTTLQQSAKLYSILQIFTMLRQTTSLYNFTKMTMLQQNFTTVQYIAILYNIFFFFCKVTALKLQSGFGIKL